MDAARIEILKMVSDGKITVEEAERLLSALDAGARTHRASAGGFWDFWKKLDTLGLDEDLKDLGELIRREVEQAVRLPFGDHDADRGEAVAVEAGAFKVPEGTGLSLFVSQRPDLELVAVAGDTCHVDGDLARVRRVDDRILVELGRSEGPAARIEVPATVRDLKVATAGCHIEATALACESTLKSMGGNVRLTDPRAPFQVRTLGGNVDARLSTPLTGRARLDSLGGRVEVALPGAQAGRVDASSGGGPLRLDPDLGLAEGSDAAGSWRGTFVLGGEEGDLDLSVRSVGGPVRLKRTRS